MMREMLRNKRHAITVDIEHPINGQPFKFAVSFGFDEKGCCREAFCLAFKSGTDLQALLHDSLIAISLGLQHGASMAELARILGEDEPKPAQSIISAIVRTGARLDREIAEVRA